MSQPASAISPAPVAHDVIAHCVGNFLHRVSAPAERIATAGALAADPAAPQVLEAAAPGGAPWAHQASACSARVRVIDHGAISKTVLRCLHNRCTRVLDMLWS